MFKKILIANRGEIAVRIIRACKELGIETVAVYSKGDEYALHKELASETVCIGEANPLDSYLNMERLISAACLTGCDAIHPGFGFLSENPTFARMVEKCGLVFIGPNPDVMEKMGNKAYAVSSMIAAGVPVVPGSHKAVSLEEGIAIADEIGYPVLVKASAGGGGKGIRRVESHEEFEEKFKEAQEEAIKFFANGDIYVEKCILNPKHIEVQLLADKKGNVVHLFERNCSMQRRNQKMLEEAPCQCISQKLKDNLYKSSIDAAKYVGYDSVGTIEYLVDKDENYYFIEMNTRIQVEHCVTETITNIDIVKAMIKSAYGLKLEYKQEDIKCLGHAIECRIAAEDTANNFRPCPGKINFIHLPGGMGVRVDSSVYPGYEISPYYDSMILKLIVFSKTRLECIRKMRAALEELIVEGVSTTTEFHYVLLHDPKFILGNYNTSFIDNFIKEWGNNAKRIR